MYVCMRVGVLYVIIWYQLLYCRDTLGIGGLSIDRRPPSKNLLLRVWTVSHSKLGLGFIETAYAPSIVEEAGFGIFWNLEEVYSMLKWAQIAFLN